MRGVFANRARGSISTFLSTRPGSMRSMPYSIHYLPSLNSNGPTNLPEAVPAEEVPPVPPVAQEPETKSFGGWRKKRDAEDSNFSRKLVLRIAALLFSLASIVPVLVIPTKEFESVFTFFFVPAWIGSIVWNLVWISVMLNRTRPISPGAIIGLDLIVWVGFFICSAVGWLYFTGFDSYDQNKHNKYSNGNSSGAGGANGQNMYTNGNATQSGMFKHHSLILRDHDGDHNGGGSGYNASDPLLISFGISSSLVTLAIVANFWTFVLACMDENRRRKAIDKAQRAPKVVVMCSGCSKGSHASCSRCVNSQADTEKEKIDFLSFYSPTREMRDGRMV